MICISGWAGTGKDECSNHLVKKYGAVHTGLADPGKRHLMDAYNFSFEQLWGPSKFRNAGDPRYPKPIVSNIGLLPMSAAQSGYYAKKITEENLEENLNLFRKYGANKLADFLSKKKSSDLPCFVGVTDVDPEFFLSPRESLQKYMELMNTLYADTWIRKGINIHKQLADTEKSTLMDNQIRRKFSYSKEKGVFPIDGVWEQANDVFITCYSDFRHIHEHELARASWDGTLIPVLVRIKRPCVTKPPFDHRSETEQTRIRDAAYDFILNNSGTLDELYKSIDFIVQKCSDPLWEGLAWSQEFILPEVQEKYIP